MTDDGDPRVTRQTVRRLNVGDSSLTLVGVVHDHPASIHRVRAVVRKRRPSHLGLEIPPLAVPLFRRYAGMDEEPPRGGEMTAAIRAAPDASVLGIDGPSVRFLPRLARRLASAEEEDRGARQVLGNLARAGREALSCRVASRLPAIRGDRDVPAGFDVDWLANPRTQADDERRHLSRARSMIDVFGTPDGAGIRDDARETHMGSEIERMCQRGDAVAVVGHYHLNAIAAALGTDGH